jgi:hypothetical protein
MVLDFRKTNIILTLVLLLPLLVQASVNLPSEKKLRNVLKDIKAVELDINGNGKPDYYREFDEDGKLRFIRYDYNEDGNPEFQIELDTNGYKIEELVDRNYDGKIDYKVICKQKDCIRHIDQKFDGNFTIDGKQNPERYSQSGKLVDEFRIFLNYKNLLNKK